MHAKWVWSCHDILYEDHESPFSVLEMQGHTSVVYVDDSYLQGDSYEGCLKNGNDKIIMLQSLGFTIHPEKSVLTPTQNLIYLGFIINLQKRKNKKCMSFVPNFLKNQNPQ